MSNDKPFKKSFVCGGVLYAIIIGSLVATGAQNLSYRMGYVFSTCLFPAVATGAWGAFSKKEWGWVRFAVTVIVFYVLFGLIMLNGSRHN